MNAIRTHAPRATALLFAAVLFGGSTMVANAQDPIGGPEVDAAYSTWLERYGDWDRADAEAAGFIADPVCVSAAAVGLPEELGSMGFHAIHMANFMSGMLDVDRPHALLIDADDKVVGVEYEWLEVEDPAPEIVPGLPLEFTPPHPGMEHDHMSRHIYFVGHEDHRYSTWNPAVHCPATAEGEADLPREAATADESESVAEDESRAKKESEAEAKTVVAASMPEAGVGDLLPSGTMGLLLLAAVALLGAALAGALRERAKGMS